MHRLPTLLSGIFLVFLTSWLGLVAYPTLQLGRLTPVVDPETGGTLPAVYGGQALAGQRIYASEGCVSCHSQQVRQASVTSSDIERGWGTSTSAGRQVALRSSLPSFRGLRGIAHALLQ
ncbi:MAG: hypothetical protein K8R38_01255 [Verrucomicrobia bacterium]|nr:hypothetical protein [Verrucomicrobiota bacterium]